MDIIGKFLTPVLLIILIGTIIIAIFNPAGEMVAGSPGLEQGMIDSLFIKGFTEGYQTMDALGSALMAGIVVTDLINKGYNDEKKDSKYPSVLVSLQQYCWLSSTADLLM